MKLGIVMKVFLVSVAILGFMIYRSVSTADEKLSKTAVHSLHTFGSCVGCHMPHIAKSEESEDIHSHVFVTLLPKDTLENPEIPNSCQSCHKHKDEDVKKLNNDLKKFKERFGWPAKIKP
ncbi:hypothetical protein LCGC14_2040590 [marine sediment metagenome]|uniref:Cytochrome c-552/4 domain-containing protein n=1 Tax=marine sediment metagenome TaxID=412755 RepID=A0A0F9ERX5_9ZZZZ